MKYNYYKIKHENIRGGHEQTPISTEEFNDILDRVLEHEDNHKDMEDFETEREYFDWLETEQDKIIDKLEAGERINYGDYDLIAERGLIKNL